MIENLHARLKPDIYRNPEEVIWKYIALDAYSKVIEQLRETEILGHKDVRKLHIDLIDLFNSTHNREIMCARIKVLLGQLQFVLTRLSNIHIYNKVLNQVQEASQISSDLLTYLEPSHIQQSFEGQSYIDDGSVTLAALPMEIFASQQDYFLATLKLFGDHGGRNRQRAQDSFISGFMLTPQEMNIIDSARGLGLEIVDLITQLMLNDQTKKHFASLAELEHAPLDETSANKRRHAEAIAQAYYFIGRIMRGAAYFSAKHADPIEDVSDPVVAFLKASGKDLTLSQIAAVRRVALAHASHGLNSGELTARLAGSVRTTFPRALIASFNVRSGKLHAGAVELCMNQTGEFLSSSTEAKAFIGSILSKKQVLYGFGHRIHKISINDGPEQLAPIIREARLRTEQACVIGRFDGRLVSGHCNALRV